MSKGEEPDQLSKSEVELKNLCKNMFSKLQDFLEVNDTGVHSNLFRFYTLHPLGRMRFIYREDQISLKSQFSPAATQLLGYVHCASQRLDYG